MDIQSYHEDEMDPIDIQTMNQPETVSVYIKDIMKECRASEKRTHPSSSYINDK